MSSEPLFHCLTLEEWKNVTKICNYSEVKVLYYILSENPMGDRVVDCRVRTIAQEMGISVGAVSKAIKGLEQKGLVGEVIITRADITIQPRIISDRAKEYLAKKNQKEGNYLEHEVVHSSEHAVHSSEHAVHSSEHAVHSSEQKHLYIDRVRGDFLKTSTDLKKIADTGTAATATAKAEVELKVFDGEQPQRQTTEQSLEVEQIEVACQGESQALTVITQVSVDSEEESSAAPDAEILKEIERIAHNWRLRPWKLSAQHFKPDMLKAVWQCNPGYYSLQGTNTPNQHHILKTLQLLERQLKTLDVAAVNAYHELMRYWQTAQALANPQVQHAFVAAAAQSKEQIAEMERQRRIQEKMKLIEDL